MRVVSPASTANLGPGFDVFGLAVDAYWDTLEITPSRGDGIVIRSDGGVPQDIRQNTAGVVVQAMQKDFGICDSMDITIQKGVPAGYGMGSSAASAAAAAVAFDALYGLNLDRQTLAKYAGYGEIASAGTIHYDNVAASVYGGFVVVRPEPFGIVGISPPADLLMCIATPHTAVPNQKTKVSRGAIPASVSISDMTSNLACAACVAAGFASGRSDVILESMQDIIVEPARRHMIPGFADTKRRAIEARAGAVCISGAGPSIIAFGNRPDCIKDVESAMVSGFEGAGVSCDTVLCKPAAGSHPVA